MFRIVQPYGPDKGRQATIISEHASAAEAFAEIDRLSAQMLRTGASLSEIGQLLRHRRVLTTAIYAKVDREALRTIARPWPGDAA